MDFYILKPAPGSPHHFIIPLSDLNIKEVTWQLTMYSHVLHIVFKHPKNSSLLRYIFETNFPLEFPLSCFKYKIDFIDKTYDSFIDEDSTNFQSRIVPLAHPSNFIMELDPVMSDPNPIHWIRTRQLRFDKAAPRHSPFFLLPFHHPARNLRLICNLLAVEQISIFCLQLQRLT